MADGSAGVVYLDLVVRNTIAQQVGALADKLKEQTQKVLLDWQKSVSNSAEKAGETFAKPMAKAGKTVTAAMNNASGATEKLEESLTQAKGRLRDYYEELKGIKKSTYDMLRSASDDEQANNILEIQKLQVDALNEKYAAQLAAVEKITRELEEQKKNAEISGSVQAYQMLRAEIEKTGKRLETILERQKKLEAIGTSATSKSWKSLQYDLDLTAREYRRLADAENQILRATGDTLATEKRTVASREALAQRAADTKAKMAKETAAATAAAEQAAADKAAAAEAAAAQKAAAAREREAQRALDAQAKAAQREIDAQARAAQKAADAQARAAQQAAAAQEREARKAAAAQEAAAKKAEEAHRKAAEATRQKWKNAMGTLGKGLAAPLTRIAGKIGSVFKRGFGSAEKHAGRFGTRLKGIISGALIFNGISAGLRSLTQYFSSAIGQTSEMQSAMANLKGAAATAAAPLIQILTPALAALANVAARVFATIAQVVSLLTGKSVASMASAAKGMQAAGSAAGGAAKQMEKAKRSLSGFDEIEKLEAPDSGTGSGGGGGAGGSDINYDAALDMDTIPISEKLAGIFDVFKSAWDNQGQKTINAMKSAFESVKALAGSVGDSFYEVFTNGTGQQTLESILSIFQNIMGCVDKLAERLKVAWDDNGNGTAIIQAWWDGLNDILDMFDRMSGATEEWLGGLDLSPALGSFAQFMSTCESLNELITGALADAYEDVLLPLASWTIEDAAPACIDLLSAALKTLRDVLDPVWEGLKKLLDHLKPVAEFIGDVVIDCLNGLKNIFEKVGNTFQEKGDKIKEIFSGVGEIIAEVWERVRPIFERLRSIVKSVFDFIGDIVSDVIGTAIDILHGLIDFIAGIFTGDWDRAWKGIKEIFSGIWDGIKGIATSIWNFLKDIWSKIKDDVAKIWNGIKEFFSNIWNGIKETASNIWNGIKSAVMNVVNGIKTGVTTAFTAVKNKVSEIFNGVKKIISNIWNGIVSTIKGAINGIIGGINGMIRGVVNGLNAVIRLLNKLHFSIPDWVPGLGGKSFGFNIGLLNAPQIPLLAKGGVIKQPTLAMMGEYPGAGSNPEIAAPQSAITEAVAMANGDVVDAILQVAKEIIDAIQESGGIIIGDEVLGRAVDRYSRKQAVMSGGLV